MPCIERAQFVTPLLHHHNYSADHKTVTVADLNSKSNQIYSKTNYNDVLAIRYALMTILQ